MTNVPEIDRSDFDGRVRLFPLPNLVVFPHSVQPLHIFEPRYRAMLAEALATDRLIAMALISKEQVDSAFDAPSLDPMVCVSHVITAEQLPDGRSNILLGGASRAKIIEEVDTEFAFREAKVVLIDDIYPENPVHIEMLGHELIRALKEWLPEVMLRDEQFQTIFTGDLPFGTMADIVANCLPLEVGTKQALLEEADVEQRGLLLLDAIEEFDEEFDGQFEGKFDVGDDAPMIVEDVDHRPFPPRFSDN